MSKLDDDLARALAESEQDAATSPMVVPEGIAPFAKPKPRREVGLLAALLVMGGGILYLVMTSFNQSAIYSKTVDELMAQKGNLNGRTVRVQGTLVKGSLAKRESPCEYRFKLTKNKETLDIRYTQCVVPDTFRDVPNVDVDVTATGKLAEDGHFQASEIMAKCPSKYDMKQKAAAGEKAPHALSPVPLSPTTLN